MASYFLSTTLPSSATEVVALYEAVGITDYTQAPELLVTALNNSTFIACAWSSKGTLIGLARALSDDAAVCYLQDLLVHPDYQRQGVGRALFNKVAQRFEHVPQTIAVTADKPAQQDFFLALGLAAGSGLEPRPMLVFTQSR